VALWRSDYNYREPTGRQNHTYGLSLYLPYHGTGCTIPDMYVARSTYASSMVTGWNLYSDDFAKDQAQYIYNEYKKIQPCFQGDFYPLTEYTTRPDKWMAYQFHRKDLNAGVAFLFRRPRNSGNTCMISLSGLVDDAAYELIYENNQASSVKTGIELKKGLSVKINERPGSELISYRIIKSPVTEK
jgi:alpha-galactosidase